jgi:hypothetical protein|nr:hypothetical protein [Neorhizobium tomejilense]
MDNLHPPTNGPHTAAEWSLYGTVEVHGTERIVWHHEDDDGRDVYQVTAGDKPGNHSGYYDLGTLLRLKDLRIDDMAVVSRPVAASTVPRF